MADTSGHVHRPPHASPFKHRAFWALMLILIATKSLALLTFARYPDADECVVGIMAKHIAEQGTHPLYYYGQNYAGGASIEAHLAAVFYKVFGMSGPSLKLSAWVFTIAAAVLLYALTARLANTNAAIAALAIYTLLPGLIVWGLKTRGGYVVTLTIVPAMIWAADRMLRCPAADHLAAICMLGLIALGNWNMQSILPLTLTIAIFLSGYWLRHRQWKLLGTYAGYGVAGAAAVWWCQQKSDTKMMGSLLEFNWNTVIGRTFERLGTLVTQTANDFFQPFLNDAVPGLNWPAPITYALFLAALGYVAYRQWSQRRSGPIQPTILLLLLYVPVFVFCFAVSSERVAFCPRYFFPLIPALAILGGVALSALPRWAAAGVTVYLAAAFVWFNADLIRHPREYEHEVFYDPTEVTRLVRELDRRNIRFIRTTYVTEWQVLFESKERVIAVNLDQRALRYPPYFRRLEQGMAKGSPVAYVFETDDRWSRAFLDTSGRELAQRVLDRRGVKYETVRVDPYVLLIVHLGGRATSTPSTQP